MNQNERALADYNEAIRLDPNNPNVFNNRGFLHRVFDRHELGMLALPTHIAYVHGVVASHSAFYVIDSDCGLYRVDPARAKGPQHRGMPHPNLVMTRGGSIGFVCVCSLDRVGSRSIEASRC